jgi:hypothetical protein
MVQAYRVDDALPAINTEMATDSGAGLFSYIPEGAVVAVRGDAGKPGMLEVTWDGRRYVLFGEDLEDRATAV